jgi:hypothetical protein
MFLIIAGCLFLVERQLGLDLLKELLTDDRWYRGHKGPLCWGREVVAVGRFAQRMGG